MKIKMGVEKLLKWEASIGMLIIFVLLVGSSCQKAEPLIPKKVEGQAAGMLQDEDTFEINIEGSMMNKTGISSEGEPEGESGAGDSDDNDEPGTGDEGEDGEDVTDKDGCTDCGDDEEDDGVTDKNGEDDDEDGDEGEDDEDDEDEDDEGE